jgi:hypothetical protein
MAAARTSRPLARFGAAALLATLAGLPAAGPGCAQVGGISVPDTSPAKQHCIDGIKDEDETDIDCGGADCLACGGAACSSDGACQSGACVSGACRLPTCTDGIFDGYESSLDCGDPRAVTVGCPLCSDGYNCFNGCNCQSAYCDPGTSTCAESPTGAPNCHHCTDGVVDFDETALDCGGATCPGCAAGQACKTGTDCASGTCAGTACM